MHLFILLQMWAILIAVIVIILVIIISKYQSFSMKFE